ncbi:MAG: hypothetical protein ACRDBG_16665 [Waterburya sp.]
MRLLTRLGYIPFSTSAYLDRICEMEMAQRTGKRKWLHTFSNKSPQLEKELVKLTGKTFRQYKIHKAENEIVPLLGRLEGLVRPTLQPLNTVAYGAKIAIETIGGEEYNLMFDYCQNQFGTKWRNLNINCRSSQEQKGVDIRELLPNALKYRVFKDNQYSTLKLLLNSVNYPFNEVEI